MDKAGTKRLVALTVTLASAGALSGVALMAGSASAAPPNTPTMSSHSHHVHTGDGDCVDIASVLFNPEHRGLHQGSNASGPGRGPFHGTCDGRVLPGGPFMAELGIPPHH